MLRNSFRDLRLRVALVNNEHCLGIWNSMTVLGYSSSSKDWHNSRSRSSRKKQFHKHLKVGIAMKNKTGAENQNTGPNELFKPVITQPVMKHDKEISDIGEEIAGKLTKGDKSSVLRLFTMDKSTQMLAAQHGIEGNMFDVALQSFRKYCIDSAHLPVEQHIVFRDLIQKVGHVSDLFPFFLSHAKSVFPHLDCMEDLQKISDLTEPSQWYPLARTIPRKIIFHAGPTNSGKTYHALKRFTESASGVYCGPLRLLAMEVFDKCNDVGVPCDLITGETRRFANEDETPAQHVACTVEMANLSQEYDVAVIDEIQMIGDLQRGWSWTRTLLGIAAKEVHVCGEETAIDLVQKLMESTGDSFEVRRYQRLTSLTYLNYAVGSFDYVKPGDCIVCFSKKDIFKVFNVLVAKGHKCAVIYGDLPPGTKIMQSRKFNDQDDPCNVLVATDAVGMGLNLAIKRVVFYSLTKYTLREDHTKAISYLSTSQAQQIGGRAGRFRTQYEDGEVTTFWDKDQKHLHDIVNADKNDLEKAGINPSAEMIEMFSYHLPKASLANLLDIFVHVCKLDESYFMCNLMQFKELAQLIEHIPLPLRTRYTLCSSPLKVRKGFAQVMFVKIALRMSQGLPLTFEWLCQVLGAPFSIPRSVSELGHLEGAFDCVDIYLWLSYRYPDMFVDPDEVRQLRVKLDSIIQTFLNRGRIAEKKRKILDLSNVIGDRKAIERSIDEELELELIQNNPLQAYTPKPKPKKESEKHKVFSDVYKELEEIERGFTESESKSVREVNVESWKETSTLESRKVQETVQDIKRKADTDVKDSAEDIEKLEDSFIIKDTADDLDKVNKFENLKGEGFFTKNTDLYNEFAGSYEIKTMFQTKPKKAQLEDGKEGSKDLQNGMEHDVLPVKAVSSESVNTLDSDGIKEIALKYGLDEEEFRKVITLVKKRTAEKTEEETKTGMNEQEMNHLKNMLTSLKRKKVKQSSESNNENEKLLRKFVNSYPRKHIKNVIDDFQLSENEGLRGNNISGSHLSFSKRFAVLSGRNSAIKSLDSSSPDIGSDGENKYFQRPLSQSPEKIFEEGHATSHKNSHSYSYGATELNGESSKEVSEQFEHGLIERELEEIDVEYRSCEFENNQNGRPNETHVFYKENTDSQSETSLPGKTIANTDNEDFNSFEEKLIKQGVLSKEMIEKLKDEWEKKKD